MDGTKYVAYGELCCSRLGTLVEQHKDFIRIMPENSKIPECWDPRYVKIFHTKAGAIYETERWKNPY